MSSQPSVSRKKVKLSMTPTKQKTASSKSAANPPFRLNRNLTSVNLGKGFPKRLVVTLKYVNSILAIAPTTGTITSYVFSANGLYDPNITGAGHQPYYFDQLMGIYNHYTVIGSKITWTTIASSASEQPIHVCLWKNDDSTVTPTSMSEMQEQSESVYKLIPTGAITPQVLTMTWSAKKTFGGSVLGNDNLQGTSSANPTEQTCYILSVQNAFNTATVSTTNDIQIEYTAVFEELKDIAGS